MLVKLFFSNRIIHMSRELYKQTTNIRYTIQFEQVYALLNTFFKSILFSSSLVVVVACIAWWEGMEMLEIFEPNV